METGIRFRAARALVGLAALIVPRHERARFVREWNGELATEAERGQGWSVVGAAWGAFADARAMSALERDRNGRWSMAEWMGGWTRDLGLALRAMRRSPLFTGVAVLTLAVGIGGTSALYTLLDRIVLDPLPYPEPERLVRLENQVPGVGADEVWNLSTAQWVYFTDHARTIEQLGVYHGDGGNVLTASGPHRVRTATVTASMMPLLGVRARLGRVITPADDTPSSAPVVLLSHGFWQSRLGADSSVVGRTLDLDGHPIEVIGVLEHDPVPPGWPRTPDVWLPLRVDRAGEFFNSHYLPGVARLAPGETPASVEAEIERLTAELPATFPRAYSQGFFDRYGFRTRVLPLEESVVGELSARLWILFGGMGLVLLIACANVANLFLVRMEGRRREMGIRAAVGAGRSALARYVLAEGMVLAFLGAGLALLVAFWAVPALGALASDQLARTSGVAVDGGTVLFTLALAVLVGGALAGYPLVAHAGPWAAGVLSEGGRAVSAGPGRQRVRSALVVTQVALALTLTVGSGLLVRTLDALRHEDIGFEPEAVLTLDIFPGPDRYPDAAAQRGFLRDVLERVRAIPGVLAAGVGNEVPVAGGYGCWVQGFEDRSVYQRIEDAGLTTCAGFVRVTPGYFEALGIPLVSGRLLDERDFQDQEILSVVVSQAFAERFWPGQDPIGQGVVPGRTEPPFHRVVGVVGDVPASSAGGQPPLSQTAMAIYYPMAGSTLVVKAGVADPVSLFPAIRRAVAEVDPEAPLADLTDMETIVGRATAQLSFVALLLAIAAGMALLLAAVGMYGVISYVVGRRTHEIGMRMAVGARPAQVQRMVVRESAAVVAGGLALGVIVALLATRTLRGLLVGVAPTDPLVYASAGALLTAVALLASWLPARRASRVDPLEALRSE